MLAKQGWRMLTRANPLVSQIMQTCYFPYTDFLNASLGPNPSYMWHNIMAAQEEVQLGCRRRIGNGETTKYEEHHGYHVWRMVI